MADVTVKYKNTVIAEMSSESIKVLNTSGKYCEDNVEINYIPPIEIPKVNFKQYDLTLEKSSAWVFLTELDEEILSHMDDPKLTVMLAINDEYVYEFYSGSFFVASNTPYGMISGYPCYGYSHRQTSETACPFATIFYPPNYTGQDSSLGGYAQFRLDGSNYYIRPSDGFVRAGSYRLIFTW